MRRCGSTVRRRLRTGPHRRRRRCPADGDWTVPDTRGAPRFFRRPRPRRLPERTARAPGLSEWIVPPLQALTIPGLLFLGLLAGPRPAQAQLSDTSLVGNMAGSSEVLALDSARAQVFTTGSRMTGYNLLYIRLDVGTLGTSGAPDVDLWSVTDGKPAAKLADLANPKGLGTGQNNFYARAGTRLEPGSDYAVVIGAWSGAELNGTASDDESGTSGWSIADESRSTAGAWSASVEHDDSLRMTVRGYQLTGDSNDATLSSLEVYDIDDNAVSLTPTFASGTTSYTATVTTSLFWFTAPTSQSNAPRVLFDSEIRGLREHRPTNSYGLAAGDNTITLGVTAPDGSTSITYTIVITRPGAVLSGDATLSGIRVEQEVLDVRDRDRYDADSYSAPLSPAFLADTLSYTVTATLPLDDLLLSVNASHSEATITSTDPDGTVDSETGMHEVAYVLQYGTNAFTIDVEAEDGTTRTYTVTVVFGVSEAPDEARLEGFWLSHDGDWVGQTPRFDRDTRSYTGQLDADARRVTLNARPLNPDANVEISGTGIVRIANRNWDAGKRAIIDVPAAGATWRVTVTSPDADQVMVYAYSVRGGSVALESLTAAPVTGSVAWTRPAYTGENDSAEYHIWVTSNVRQVTLAAVAVSRTAEVEMPADANINMGGVQVDLDANAKTRFRVTVRAGSASTAYEVILHRLPSALTAKVKDLEPSSTGGEVEALRFQLRLNAPVELSLSDWNSALDVGTSAITAVRRIGGEASGPDGDPVSSTWRFTVDPADVADVVTVAYTPTGDCAAAGAVCTPGDVLELGALSHTLRYASIADASAELADGQIVFDVKISKRMSRRVYIDFKTIDAGGGMGTATPREDYWPQTTRLVIHPGERQVRAGVALVADSETAAGKTIEVLLENARLIDGNQEPLQQIPIMRGMATGTIGSNGNNKSTTTPSGGLTAGFESVPPEHDGSTAFILELLFSEVLAAQSRSRLLSSLQVSGAALVDVRAAVAGVRDRWRIELEPASHEAVTVSLAAGGDCASAPCTKDGRALSEEVSATVQGALTASFESVPSAHDGSSEFTLEVSFSEELAAGGAAGRLRQALSANGGTVQGVQRAAPAARDRFEVRLEPSGSGAVTVSLPAQTGCEGADALCTADGRALSNAPDASVAGPPGLSVADAEVDEGPDARLAFAVTLDRAASGTVTVQAATSDGTALAGEDYVAENRTVTFAAGETSQVVRVRVLDDSHDEQSETLTLALSSPSGAYLADGEATGTIENRDPLPRALLARFGRTAAVHVVEQVEERLNAPRAPGFEGRFAGRELRRGMERDMAIGFLRRLGASAGVNAPGGGYGGPVAGGPVAGSAGLGGPGLAAGGTPPGGAAGSMGLGGAAGSMGMAGGLGGPGAGAPGLGRPPTGPAAGAPSPAAHPTGALPALPGAMDTASGSAGSGSVLGRGLHSLGFGGGNVLTGSSFALNRETGRGGILSFWSRGARSSFSGREGTLGLNGDVRTTMFGADYATGPLVVGLSLAHSRGLGGYSGVASGQVASSVTGLYPWLGYRVSDRVSVWGVTGYGRGGMLLSPAGGTALETGLSMAMVAAGTRGELVAGGADGFGLAFKADVLRVGTASEGVDGPGGRLAATAASVSRVRTALEGSRGFALRGRLSLRPSVEVGLRHDAGDAETGAGLDLGVGLVVSDASTGLAVDLRVRTLLVHEDAGFRERGVALSLSYDPTPSTPLGFNARLAPSWGGQATSGAEALWGRDTMAGMAHGAVAQGNRMDAEVGYGLPVGSRFVGTPRVGFGASDYGRDYRLGYGLGVLHGERLNLELGVDARRRESPLAGGANNGVLARASLGW